MKPPILLTGIHRSGTTWVGRMLEQAPHIRYLYEPLNNEHPPEKYGRTMPTSYTYICKQNQHQHQKHIQHTLRGPWKTRLKELLQPTRPLWKDPHALFSAPWFAKQLNTTPLILIRHPAAFILSIIDKNWPFDFTNLTRQPLLIEHHLSHHAQQIHDATKNPGDLIDQGSLLWNIIYHRVQEYQTTYPHWHYHRHEDLARDPLPQFKTLFTQLHLPYTPHVQTAIANSTASGQPVNAQTGTNTLHRDSQELTKKWKTRLSPKDIQRIREKTTPTAPHFYNDSDW